MKKTCIITFALMLLIGICTMSLAFDPGFKVTLQYPKETKVNANVPLTAMISPSDFAMSNPLSLKITCQGCPEADYSVRKGFPTSQLTFNKKGVYALTVSTGLLMSGS